MGKYEKIILLNGINVITPNNSAIIIKLERPFPLKALLKEILDTVVIPIDPNNRDERIN
tara:strand:+ start:88 stop:264 length:177 start_codon:yes stop_codon:yes gene_type:complete